jgi:hypothetical protein
MMAIPAFKQITAILPKGRGLTVIKALKEERQVVSANLNYARGVGRMTPLRFRGVGEQTEKEVISIIVSEDLSEEIFEYVHDLANINTPHSGVLYMNSLSMANEYTLPDDLQEED